MINKPQRGVYIHQAVIILNALSCFTKLSKDITNASDKPADATISQLERDTKP